MFSHVNFPEAGIQVPKGTVGPKEDLKDAVLREVQEETGLTKIFIKEYLGKDEMLISYPKIEEPVKLNFFFFHICVEEQPKTSWNWLEKDPHPSGLLPDDIIEIKKYGGIRLQLYWVPLNAIPPLMANLGKFLFKLF